MTGNTSPISSYKSRINNKASYYPVKETSNISKATRKCRDVKKNKKNISAATEIFQESQKFEVQSWISFVGYSCFVFNIGVLLLIK